VRPIDAPALVQSLSGLAEVYGARAVSDKAAKVWLDVLREFPIERVCALLSGWPKANARMPVPKDVWTVLNDERTETIEREAAAEKVKERNEVVRLFDPRTKNANMAKIRTLINASRAKGPPTAPELAQAMLDDVAEGRKPKLGMAQRSFVVAILGWTHEQIDRFEADAKRMNAVPAGFDDEWEPA
jgi:hypothetical protein